MSHPHPAPAPAPSKASKKKKKNKGGQSAGGPAEAHQQPSGQFPHPADFGYPPLPLPGGAQGPYGYPDFDSIPPLEPTVPTHAHSQHTASFPLPFPFDFPAPSGEHGVGGGLGDFLNTPLAGLSAPASFNITHDDLLSTANELYRRMAEPEFGSDDAYWSSLPSHLRQFIRDAVPFNGALAPQANGQTNGQQPGGGPGGAAAGQRAMYAMAQQIVNAASQGMGLGAGVGAGLLASSVGLGPQQLSRQPPPSAEELGFHRHPNDKRRANDGVVSLDGVSDDEYEDDDG